MLPREQLQLSFLGENRCHDPQKELPGGSSLGLLVVSAPWATSDHHPRNRGMDNTIIFEPAQHFGMFFFSNYTSGIHGIHRAFPRLAGKGTLAPAQVNPVNPAVSDQGKGP